MGFIFEWPFRVLGHIWRSLWPLVSLAGVALYVLRALGLYRMARNTGVKTAWFAWVPLLHEYQCAKMGDRTRLAQGKTAFIEKWMVLLAAAWVLVRIFSPIFWNIFLIGWIYRIASGLISLLLFASAVLADYWLYMDFEPSMAALYALLSIVKLDGIPKFIVRDNVPVGVAGLCNPKQPKYGV